MKKSLRCLPFILSLLFIQHSLAQTKTGFPFSMKEPTGPDTLFYPFYNGVQMIEIDRVGWWENIVNFYEVTQPRALEWSSLIPWKGPNIYLFRDSTKRIVKAFNTNVSLATLTAHFLKVPLKKKSSGITALFMPYHKGKRSLYEGGMIRSFKRELWFDGFYKVYTDPLPSANSFFYTGIMGSGPCGLIDSLGNYRIPPEYDQIIPVYGLLLLSKDGKCGMEDINRNVILPMEYDRFEFFSYSGIAFYQGDSLSGIFNQVKKKFYPLPGYEWMGFDFVANAEMYKPQKNWQPFIPVRKNGKRGLLDTNFTEVVPVVYDFCNPPRQERSRVCRNSKWGYMNTRGEEVIACTYEDAGEFSKGCADVYNEGKWIRIDTNGLPCDTCKKSQDYFGHPFETNNGTFMKRFRIAERNHFQGIMSSDKKIVVPILFEQISGIGDPSFKEGYSQNVFRAKRYDKFGIIDTAGQIILPFEYDYIDHFRNECNLVMISRDKLCGMANRSFRFIIPCLYEGLNPYSIKGRVIYTEKGKNGILDTLGNRITEPIFDQIGWLNDGMARASKNKLFGMIDANGKEVIPFQYDQIGDKFYNGLLMFQQNGKWGFLDLDGNVVIPEGFDEVRNFEMKITGAKKDKKMGFIDRKGKTEVQFIYDFIGHTWYKDGTVTVRRNGKIGFVNEKGNEVIPCEYDDDCGFWPDNGHHLKKNGQWIWVKAK
ncbi:MAG: WG repeat-containing protein [Bacteroidota bacterium]